VHSKLPLRKGFGTYGSRFLTRPPTWPRKKANCAPDDEGQARCLPNVSWDPVVGSGWGRISDATLPGMKVSVAVWTTLQDTDSLRASTGAGAAAAIVDASVMRTQGPRPTGPRQRSLQFMGDGIDNVNLHVDEAVLLLMKAGTDITIRTPTDKAVIYAPADRWTAAGVPRANAAAMAERGIHPEVAVSIEGSPPHVAGSYGAASMTHCPPTPHHRGPPHRPVVQPTDHKRGRDVRLRQRKARMEVLHGRGSCGSGLSAHSSGSHSTFRRRP